MKIRSAAAFVAALWLLPIADACPQTGYPDHAVRMVVGYAPGGPLDIIARILSERFAQMWGQPVVVDNLTGASGNIAAEHVAKAAPDGYTLFVARNAQLIINPSLYKNIPYDSDKDFVLISQAVFTPNILVVPNDLPVKNVQELVAYAKAHPGLTFASAGVGTTQHLAGEMFKAMAHIDIQHCPTAAPPWSSPISWAGACRCSLAPPRPRFRWCATGKCARSRSPRKIAFRACRSCQL